MLLGVIQLLTAYGKRDGISWLGLTITGLKVTGQFRGLKDDRLFNFSWSDTTLLYSPAKALQPQTLSLGISPAAIARLRGSKKPQRYADTDTYKCGDRMIPAGQACMIRHAKLRQAFPLTLRQLRQEVKRGS